MNNKYTEILIKRQHKAEGDLILMAMPDEATLNGVSSIQHGHGGKTVYSFGGKPFLEIYPPQFETVREEDAIKLRLTQNYRVIK